MARRRATVVSQAAGLAGTPERGHVSRARTSASWAASSARPTSPRARASPAMILGDSMRQTVSMTPFTSLWLTTSPAKRSEARRWTAGPAIHLRMLSASVPGCNSMNWGPGGSTAQGLALGHLLAHAVVPFLQLRGAGLAEILGLKERPDFDDRLAPGGLRAALDPLDGLVQGPDLPDPVPGHQLLGLGKGPVDHRNLAVGPLHPGAPGAGRQAVAVQQDAGLDQLLVVGRHVGQQL